jgi:DNA-binding CsgD family transcriptional regulator
MIHLPHQQGQSQRHRIQRAQQVLISPFDCADGNSWCAEVVRECKALLGADKGTILAPMNGDRHAFSEGISVHDQGAFFKAVQPLDAKWSMWNRQVELGTWTRRAVWGRWINQYVRTDYYNEFVVPKGLFDAVGLSVHLGASGTTARADTTATLWFHHDRPTGRRFGTSGFHLLRELFPAFSAGIGMLAKLDAHRASLVRVIDDLGVPLFVAAAGDRLHRTPALQQLLTDDGDGMVLLSEIVSMAGALSRLHSHRLASATLTYATPGDAVLRVVATRAARYRLRASIAGAELMGVGPLTLVFVERITPVKLSAAELSDRWRLSYTQAQIAIMIGEGLNYQRIAELRGISLHTVRRHAEQIRARLGAHSAAEIASILAGRSLPR